MTIEAYFDGTAVRPLEEVSLEPNQKVFINIPEKTEYVSRAETATLEEKLEALNAVCGMLTPEEAEVFDEVISHKVNFTSS